MADPLDGSSDTSADALSDVLEAVRLRGEEIDCVLERCIWDDGHGSTVSSSGSESRCPLVSVWSETTSPHRPGGTA